MPFGTKVDRPKTLILNVPEQLRTGAKEDFVKKIVDAVTGHRVSAVQFVPGFFVRVTFSTVQDRHVVFRYGVEIDGVKIPLTEAESTTRFVYVSEELKKMVKNLDQKKFTGLWMRRRISMGVLFSRRTLAKRCLGSADKINEKSHNSSHR